MGKVLEWKQAGPAREKSIAVPPVSIGNWSYALAYDEKRKCTVYVRAREYGGEIEQWTYDGAWEKAKGGGRISGNEAHSYYDPTRNGVLWWNTEHDYEAKRAAPCAVLVTEGKIQTLKTTGDKPLIEPKIDDSFYLSSNIGCTVTFDRRRNVGVCLTRRGVWELDAAGTWTRRAEEMKIIPQEWNDDAGGVWDPVGKRCVFWIQGRENKYKHIFYSWDGEKLAVLATKGLPDVCIGLFDPAIQFCSQPHGIIGQIGGELYELSGTTWKKLPTPKGDAPPKTEKFKMTFDVSRDSIIVGPGNFDGDEGGADAQAVFFELRDNAWHRMGAVASASKLNESGSGNKRHAVHAGSWYATAWSGLLTMRWTGDDWEELVDDKTGDKLVGNDRQGGLVSTPEGLVAVTQKGAVFRLEKGKWKQLAKSSPAFKDRSEFILVHDGTRLVAWGGEVKNRKANDTLVFDGKKWNPIKTASPQPKDFKQKDLFVDFTAVYDSALGRIVRFGYEEVAVLEVDVWKPYTPANYTKLVGSRSWGHYPAHDPKTGETLLVNFDDKRIIRFDLAKCEEVARFAYDKELEKQAKREHEYVPTYFTENFVFDPTARSIETQRGSDKWFRYSLALGSVFDAKRSARKLLGPAKSSAKPTFYKFANGKLELSAKPKAGYVTAAELSKQVLEAIGTRKSSALVVTSKKPASHATSRIGGLPSGVTAEKWPKIDGKPMGFLFQLLTGDQLAKHAAIAVFVALDGTATEDEDRNRVVLLSKADLARAPLKAAPEGVPVLKERAITTAAPLPEIDEGAIGDLTEQDPELAAAFDRYQADTKVQDSNLASKLGGAPVWLQDGPDVPIVAQLDLDYIRLDKSWESAGLAGCIYILTDKHEKSASAMWQYT